MQEGFRVFRPKVDGIAFTVDIDLKDREPIANNLKEVSSEHQVLKRLKPVGRYALRFKLLAPNGEAILIEAAPKSKTKQMAFLRLEMNPQKVEDWKALLTDEFLPLLLIEYGWEYIRKNAKVTQLDVAIDMLGVGPERLLIEDPKGKPNKRMLYVGETGVLETVYPVSATMQGTKAYDKLKQLLEDKEKPEFGETPLTRVEVPLRPNKPFSALPKIKNPLTKLVVRDASKAVSAPESTHSWSFFLSSCQLRGTRRTLEAITDPDAKGAYLAALKAADRHVWRPEKLWKFWRFSLKQAGLAVET